LHEAALKGHREIVELLLERGAAVNARNSSGATPLHDAALAGRLAVIEILLRHGAEIDARDRDAGATPLHQAASWGRREAVELLIAKGAAVDLRNKAGVSPLQAAMQNGHTETADCLRSHGAKE
jgi:ankyrin repeat protein